jgi:RNA-directed DNA polymerase
MRQMRHLTIGQQVDELNDALRGHYGYYGIAGNIRGIMAQAHQAGESST